MIFEDQRASESDRLGFVLHLGDFIYEIVWYPEDRPQGMYDRRLRDVVRYANGQKLEDFHIPTTVEQSAAALELLRRTKEPWRANAPKIERGS